MSVRKSSHGTIFLIVSSGSPLALIASSLRSTSKKPVCPMTRSLHPAMTACGHRVRFVATWREEFFEVPYREFPRHAIHRLSPLLDQICPHSQIQNQATRYSNQYQPDCNFPQPRHMTVRFMSHLFF